ncbi:MAG TPA: hypothetical protein VKA84_20080 [Gemmatimonadaceae bacterium]|nr:hypothetical protein [Gemmatimonadaceae bacterium]
MRLMREEEVPAVGGGRTFRYSAARALAGAMLGLAGAAALLIVGRVKGAPVAYYAAAVVLLLVWLFRGVVAARFRPTNWLARGADDGVYVKFRSYLNHHMPAEDHTVAFVPYREIRRARLVRETRRLPDPDRSGTTTRQRTVVELELRDEAPELERALADERAAKGPAVRRWYGTSRTRYRHHPVRMPSPRLLEIEWGVVPDASAFLGALGAHVDAEARDVAIDDTRRGLAALDRAAQERRLRALAEGGEVMTAVKLARSLYGYGLGEAKRFVESLVDRGRL